MAPAFWGLRKGWLSSGLNKPKWTTLSPSRCTPFVTLPFGDISKWPSRVMGLNSGLEVLNLCACLSAGQLGPWCPHDTRCWQIFHWRLGVPWLVRSSPAPTRGGEGWGGVSTQSAAAVFSEIRTKFLVFLFLNTYPFVKPQLNRRNALQVGQVNHDSYSTKKHDCCKIRTLSPSHLYSACLTIPSQNCKNQKVHMSFPLIKWIFHSLNGIF